MSRKTYFVEFVYVQNEKEHIETMDFEGYINTEGRSINACHRYMRRNGNELHESSTAEEMAKGVLAYYNATLRPNENPRHYKSAKFVERLSY